MYSCCDPSLKVCRGKDVLVGCILRQSISKLFNMFWTESWNLGSSEDGTAFSLAITSRAALQFWPGSPSCPVFLTIFIFLIYFLFFGNWTLDVWGSSVIVTDFRLVQFHKFGQITFTIWHCKYSQSCAFWKSESSQVKQLFCCQKTTWILGMFFFVICLKIDE